MNKRLKNAYKLFDSSNYYSINEAFDILSNYKNNASAKFNESVDLDVLLGVDTNKSEQNIKGFVELPYGNGKKVKVLAFADGQNIDKALQAGAAYAGGEELINDVFSGKISDFDKCVATKDMMPKIAKLARILGPRGLMPNPKLGTVIENDIDVVIKSLLKGRSDIKTSKDGSVKVSIGKLSFDNEKLIANMKEFISALKQLRPSTVKANFFKGVYISTTMGIGVKIKMSDIYSL